MAAALEYPRFSWSESRHRRFQECRRRYYWSVYGSHNGWHPQAPAERQLAWRLSKLVPSWAVALGTAVHARAAACVAACRTGRALPSFAVLRRACATDLNGLYETSLRRLDRFRRAPQRWPALAAAFYRDPWDAEEIARTAMRLDATLDRLLRQTWLWDAIRAAAPGDTIIPDRFHAFELRPDRIMVYAAPDLLLRRRPGAPMEIWDFKIGCTDGAIDQLLTYALAARDGLGIASTGGFAVGVVALGAPVDRDDPARLDDAASAGCLVTSDDVADAAARIRASAAAMRAPLLDESRNVPPGPEAFPRTEHRWRCAQCSFRGLCEPELLPPGGASA